LAPLDLVTFANVRASENRIDSAVADGGRLSEPRRDGSTGLREPLDDRTPSMRTRSLVSADVSSCVWMAGKAEESNALIVSKWPGVGRRWLPDWLREWTGLVADLSDKSANLRRVAMTTGITLSDGGSRRERTRTRRYGRQLRRQHGWLSCVPNWPFCVLRLPYPPPKLCNKPGQYYRTAAIAG